MKKIITFILCFVTVNIFAQQPVGSHIRSMAEWEEVQAFCVSWKPSDTEIKKNLIDIIKAAKSQCRVMIMTSTPATVQTELNNANVDTNNISIVTSNVDRIWVRDYGPNSVYLNSVDSLVMLDWKYNRNRPSDDTVVPKKIANFLNIPFIKNSIAPFDLVNTGGNYMTDGLGTAFASKLILDENDGIGDNIPTTPKTEPEVDAIMKNFMGISRYVKMEILPYDLIHHIDMHMKLLDEETLLVGQYPDGVADGPQIEANLQYVLSQKMSVFGTPYRVVRIPMPPDAGGSFPDSNGDYRTYANASFVNKSILVPFYEQKYDTVAQRIWQENMPGYQIIGINNCNSIITQSGAVHCITKEIGVTNPLLIVHQRLRDVTVSKPQGYSVNATIKHKSGVSEATIWYKTSLNGNYLPLAMNITDATNNIWSGTIPEQINGTSVYYYIAAVSTSGKQIARPMPAPEGYWKFKILISNSANEIEKAPQMLDIYPNPASSITCIPVISGVETYSKINLKDILGRDVETIFEGRIPVGESRYFLHAERYAAGVYFVTFSANSGKIWTQKLVIR